MGTQVNGGEIPIIRGPYPEFTWTAVIVGWLIGSLIAVSIAYAALIVGFSIEGSELAAILGWGVLRGVLRRRSIVENNINQTIASAVNGASAGIMFSLPAILILSRKEEFASLASPNVPLLMLAAITGCVLGLAFVIPLRKQMIDLNRLAYPGGIAVAVILKSPGSGVRKAMLLLCGIVVSATIHGVLVMWLGDDPHWDAGHQWGAPSMLNLVFKLSVMTVAVGYLSGRGGLWFGAGGFLCYLVIGPILYGFLQWKPDVWVDGRLALTLPNPNVMRVSLYRPTGIGMLIGAAIGGIIAAFPMIRGAFASLRSRGQIEVGGKSYAGDELPIRWLFVAIAASSVILVWIAFQSSSELGWGRAVLLTGLGVLWIWIAGVIVAECVGRTNWSPLSGMTLIAVTLMILVTRGGLDRVNTILCAITVGTAICLAISQASDMMLDLKAGYLVGAIPKRQQLAQLVGCWLGPIIVILLMFLLHEYRTIGSDSLPAPQATALADTMQLLVDHDAPTYRYVAGGALGLLLALSGLGGIGVLIALGFYMPFAIVLTYSVGNLIRLISDAVLGNKAGYEIGIPIAAGLIVGESLMGVGFALNQIILNMRGF
ncbi:MAG TPA: OPT/YSL family transporter [Pirellulaceae bacterium]|nr:OPT/YSL family transporter [Pirellulaceae bacterium]